MNGHNINGKLPINEFPINKSPINGKQNQCTSSGEEVAYKGPRAEDRPSFVPEYLMQTYQEMLRETNGHIFRTGKEIIGEDREDDEASGGYLPRLALSDTCPRPGVGPFLGQFPRYKGNRIRIDRCIWMSAEEAEAFPMACEHLLSPLPPRPQADDIAAGAAVGSQELGALAALPSRSEIPDSTRTTESRSAQGVSDGVSWPSLDCSGPLTQSWRLSSRRFEEDDGVLASECFDYRGNNSPVPHSQARRRHHYVSRSRTRNT
ncbi:hypothetical protein VPNG_06018 [Cytospora leucostoma]|uniref:Uncharacterized protein n=1 Tax=Cytospora leucostoma TaxID=1230097 RepID=A0A423XB18_9PEZI|nr:hypothetical protein VPNG_06018 [Cytospora leucostoma]